MIDYQGEVEEQKAMQQMEMKEKTDMVKVLNSFNMLESQQDQDFFQDNNDDQKTKKTQKYSSTKVKARTLVTNAPYRRFKSDDFNKSTFVLDSRSFLVQNLNPLGLDRNLKTEAEGNYVKMVWDKCLPSKFRLFVLTEKNYLALP